MSALEKIPAVALAEMDKELEAAELETIMNHPVTSYIKKVYFVSKSKGRGRKRKYPKEVTLLVYGDRCYTVRDTPTNGLDNVAREILGDLIGVGDDEWKIFLEIFNAMKPVTNI